MDFSNNRLLFCSHGKGDFRLATVVRGAIDATPRADDLSCHRWSPQNRSPGPSAAKYVAVDGPPGPSMAAIDGPHPDHPWRCKWSPIATDGPLINYL